MMLLSEIPSDKITHVYPTDDLVTHWVDEGDGDSCPCQPTVRFEGDSAIIIHNAWDHREIIEQANEILEGEDGD